MIPQKIAELLRIVASMEKRSITKDNLEIFSIRNNLPIDSLLEFCKNENITIVYDYPPSPVVPEKKNELSPEEKELRRKCRDISSMLCHAAATITRNNHPPNFGWICGTYVNGIRDVYIIIIRKVFIEDEIDLIQENITMDTIVEYVSDPEHFDKFDDEKILQLLGMLRAIMPKVGMIKRRKDYLD